MSKTVVILGGGSSGWMTAAYLSRALTQQRIILIESTNIRTIGVGEATFSYMKLFFDHLGLRERDWMPHCSGAYKMAIRFVNWTKQGGHFYHPFQRYEMACGINLAEWWLKLLRDEEAFDYACFTTSALCDAMKAPRHLDGTVFDEKVGAYYADSDEPPNSVMTGHMVQYPYGYHVNAAELAHFLRGYAVKRGVTRIADDVVEVLRREDGGIAGLRTREHGIVEGDLFVDCTGFRGLLINQTLGEPFTSFNDTLLNDSAVALQVPRDVEKLGMRPYTTAHAHSAGWSWNIPLYGRDGTGYVYSSKFIDKDEAEREFREFLGPASDGCVANHVNMRIGRNRRSWVKNCVAVGLSSGFVEPLESTGLFFVHHAIEELVNHFPHSSVIDENVTKSYNKTIAECIDGVREFLTLHYFASDRDDTPYWRATKQVTMPDSLRERFDIWKSRLPTPRTIYPSFHGFEPYSWSVMLLGLNYRPAGYLPLLDQLDESRARAAFQSVKTRTASLLKSLPTQYEYLTHMRDLAAAEKAQIRRSEHPAAFGPEAKHRYVSGTRLVPTLADLGAERLRGLCLALGYDAAEIQSAEKVFRKLAVPWGERLANMPPSCPSDITDDSTPFEFSLAIDGDTPEVRYLIEVQGEEPSLLSRWHAARAMNAALAKDLGVHVGRLQEVEDLFVPTAECPRFALWHAVTLQRGAAPEYKVYFNPQARGREHARVLVEDAMRRLGFGDAVANLTPIGPEDELWYFSLDLSPRKEARVKIYTAHHRATAERIEAAVSKVRAHEPGKAAAFCRAMAGTDGPFVERPVATCLAFVAGTSAPVTGMVHFPIRTYAADDAAVRERVLRYLHADGGRVYDRALAAFAHRRLEDGPGIQTYVALRLTHGPEHVTVYLAPEVYDAEPGAITAPTVSAVRDRPEAQRARLAASGGSE